MNGQSIKNAVWWVIENEYLDTRTPKKTICEIKTLFHTYWKNRASSDYTVEHKLSNLIEANGADLSEGVCIDQIRDDIVDGWTDEDFDYLNDCLISAGAKAD